MGVETTNAEMREAAALFERFLAGFFRQNAERYAYGHLFEPIYRDLSAAVLQGGKRVRPLLLLASYRLFGGARRLDDPALLRMATAVELFHSFILIHDDVIDRAELRRGRPTLHKRMEEALGHLPGRERLGQNLAIVVGDMLHALAVETILSSGFESETRDAALRRFLGYVGDTGCGEALDILLGARDLARVGEEEIVEMYRLKTTRYTFEAPLVLGALLAGAGEDALLDLARIAEPIGLAFQIENDLAEYAHFDLLDRAVPPDLLEGKKTLLLRVAHDRLGEVDRSFLRLCLGETPVGDSAVRRIRELVDRSGAVAVLAERRLRLLEEADALLASAALSPAQREGMRGLIAFIEGLLRPAGTGPAGAP